MSDKTSPKEEGGSGGAPPRQHRNLDEDSEISSEPIAQLEEESLEED